MKRSLVIGSEGQDGRLLFDRLEKRGDAVVGLGRGTVRVANEASGLGPVDLNDPGGVRTCIDRMRPDEVYYLAAHHHSALQRREPTPELYRLSHAVHVDGYLNVLAALADLAPASRVFYAASSHVFGRPRASPQNEQTPLDPLNVYAVTKTASIHLGRHYREVHRLRVYNGILYNHESPLRKADFVSQRIVRAATERQPLRLQNLRATVDWGFAADSVRAMTMMMAAEPGEYVVATGLPHTVQDFAREAYAAVGLDFRDFVVADSDIDGGTPLVGNASKLRRATGWQPSITFSDMVRGLVDHLVREANRHG